MYPGGSVERARHTGLTFDCRAVEVQGGEVGLQQRFDVDNVACMGGVWFGLSARRMCGCGVIDLWPSADVFRGGGVGRWMGGWGKWVGECVCARGK